MTMGFELAIVVLDNPSTDRLVMNHAQRLILVLLTVVVLVGSWALIQASSTGSVSAHASHASMSHADYGEPEEIWQASHGEECKTCDYGMAGACMMSICHPALILGGICLAAPGCELMHVPHSGSNQSKTALDVMTPPPRHHL